MCVCDRRASVRMNGCGKERTCSETVKVKRPQTGGGDGDSGSAGVDTKGKRKWKKADGQSGGLQACYAKHESNV